MPPCAVPGCGRSVSSDRLMCPPHWYRVPIPLRAAVSHAWRVRRGTLGTPGYLEARDRHEEVKRAAVAAVSGREDS